MQREGEVGDEFGARDEEEEEDDAVGENGKAVCALVWVLEVVVGSFERIQIKSNQIKSSNE